MSATTVDLPQFDPGNPQLLRDPYDIYATYREASPVHWGVASMRDLEGSWYLFRFEENAEVLSDAETFASNPASVGRELSVPEAFRPVAHIFQRWLGGMDAPDHRHLRSVLAKAFTPRRINALRPRVETITEMLVTEASRNGQGSFDIVHLKDSEGHVFATRLGNVFVIGKGTRASISLPKRKGIKRTIMEERALRPPKA